MKVLFIGDMHGNMAAWRANLARLDEPVDHIVQLGDFGIWPGNEGYLDELDKILPQPLLFLPGNHEDYMQLIELEEKMPKTKKGFIKLRDNIAYTGKVHDWYWQDYHFAAFGGAYSIDKQSRIPYISWWPQEQLTYMEVLQADKMREVDVLLTHDCPSNFPHINARYDYYSQLHREKIDHIVDSLKPPLLFHGHMHKHATYRRNGTTCYGLAHELQHGSMAMLLLNRDNWNVRLV